MDIERLKTTFESIERDRHVVADRFYARLFATAPEVNELFRSVGMEMQGRMVIQALGIAIHNVENADDFSAMFRSLGRRHATYGVRPSFYAAVVDSLVETLKHHLGAEFTDQDERDWRELVGRVAEEMAAGSEEPRAGTRGDFRRADSLDDPYLARFLNRRERKARSSPMPEVATVGGRVQLTYLGEKTVEVGPMQTILDASHAHGIPHICECGGTARCSTCRVIVLEGIENCLPRTTLESKMAEKKGFYPELRLACQTRVVGDVTIKRLVRDDNDVAMAISGSLGEAGEEIEGAVLFSDIWGFTTFSEQNLPYDIIHALNLLFRELGQAIDDHGGYVDKYIGDNVMAIFGLGGEPPEEVCRSAFLAAVEMLERLPKVNAYLRNYLGHDFRIGVGIAFGPMVVGEVGFPLKRQFTAIGDTVNIAARLESETRKHDVDLLVSDSLKTRLMDGSYDLRRSFEFALKGKTTAVVAHEIAVAPR